MKNLKSLFCMIILFTLLFNGCSDDDSDNAEPQTIMDLLTSGKWYIEAKFQDELTSCEKKGYFQFNANGSFEIHNYVQVIEGCQLNETSMGSYSLTDDEVITMLTPDASFEIYILTISEEEMIIIGDEIFTLDKIEG